VKMADPKPWVVSLASVGARSGGAPMCSDALDRSDGIRKELTAGVTHVIIPLA
jgi:hypothetical protein